MEREEIFRDLCENAHDLIQSVSPEGRFLYVNRSWLQTLGYELEEIADLKVYDVIHPDSREHCAKMMQQVMAGEAARTVEAVFLTKDGRKVQVEGSASCRFENGKPVATRGVFRDVTQRIAAEEELHQFFELSVDLLCIAGTDGFFRRINPAFEQALGYERKELLARPFLEFVHLDDREDTLRQVRHLAQGRVIVDFQNRYLARDGSCRWLAWRAAPAPGKELIYAAARDITVQRQQAQELARSNRDLEQFAYVASHDLRAPLRAVANLGEFIRQDLAQDRPEKVQRHIEQLQARVSRMQNLIDDLLSYSRVGKVQGKIERIDSGKLIDRVVDMLDTPQGFKIECDAPMPVLMTDRTPLEQVFRNLVGNALAHHDRDSGRVRISAREQGRLHEFTVEDDGPGIPTDSHDEVFQMFERLQAQNKQGGTGIGLALVKRIVENQGGRIWLEPNEGRGATFRFTWPKGTES